MGANEQREEGSMTPIDFMGFSEWHTSDIAADTVTMSKFIEYMRKTFPMMNAVQMKSLLLSAIEEIDKIAHI